jgi:hypothetical protein
VTSRTGSSGPPSFRRPRVTLSNQLGQLAGEPILDAIDAAVWGAVFPPDTPVRAREAPDWDDRHWRTFRASEVHDTAKLFSMFSMMTSPTALLGRIPDRTSSPSS